MKQALKCGCAVGALILATAAALAADDDAKKFPTATPIKHLVIIFQENVSFDHYFGTYPVAQNNSGEAPFTASSNTPTVNNLSTPLDVNNSFKPLTGLDLLHSNPNSNPNNPNPAINGPKTNGSGASNPFRLTPAQPFVADQGHNYTPEQQASDNGKMDAFPAFTGTAGPPPAGITTKGLVMGYYDGNTVTALWNYAQNYALNDNSFTTTYGPSTPGALNLIAGQTAGIDPASQNIPSSHEVADGNGNFSVIGDGDPLLDTCRNTMIDQVLMDQKTSKNIGDLLNANQITWGWFEGGFDLTITNPNGTSGCARSTTPTAPGGAATADYIPHHQPFQYFASTANLSHTRPKSPAEIGHDGSANHQYDINDFFAALAARNVPAVTFLKASAFQDGHAGYSDPLDEQHFIVGVINALQESPDWHDTAVIITYDDSDGWYDHQMAPVVNRSRSTADAINGLDPMDPTKKIGLCNDSVGFQQNRGSAPATPLDGFLGKPAQGRCGYGTRIPLLAISPWAKSNYVDHTLTDQTSILRFIEDNWLNGARVQPGGSFDTIAGPLNNMFNFDNRSGDASGRKLILDPTTGAVDKGASE
jgi:phospholipase C